MTKHSSTNPKTRKTWATSRSIGIDLGDRFSELCVLDGEIRAALARTTPRNLQVLHVSRRFLAAGSVAVA